MIPFCHNVHYFHSSTFLWCFLVYPEKLSWIHFLMSSWPLLYYKSRKYTEHRSTYTGNTVLMFARYTKYIYILLWLSRPEAVRHCKFALLLLKSDAGTLVNCMHSVPVFFKWTFQMNKGELPQRDNWRMTEQVCTNTFLGSWQVCTYQSKLPRQVQYCMSL